MLTEVLCVLLGSVVFFYYYFYQNYDYWEVRGVPFVKPQFLFGNYKDAVLGRKHIGVVQTELYNKFPNARYAGYFKLKYPAIILRDPELIKDVLVKDFNHFVNNEFQVDPSCDPIFASNPFSKQNEDWKTTRGQWSTSLTVSKIKVMYEIMWEKAKIMDEYIRDHVQRCPDQPFEGRELSATFFTDVVVAGIFGLEINSWKVVNNPFRAITSSIFQATFWDGYINLCLIIAPWLSRILKLRFVSKRIELLAKGVARDILATGSENSILKNDIYEVMKKYNELDSKNEISVMDLAGRVFGFLLDGTETSSGVFGLILFELASNQEVQTKLRDELDKAAPKDENIPFDVLDSLPYMDMVFSETLRMHGPLLSMNRVCSKEYSIPPATPQGKAVTVPVGMTVTIPTFALQMDPQYFPDPNTFNPERFSAENKNSVNKFAYLPFGGGPRACIGVRFATTQTKVCLAKLIRNYELTLSPKGQQKPVDIDPTVFVYRASKKLLIDFKIRKE